jgi:hypothetical protein
MAASGAVLPKIGPLCLLIGGSMGGIAKAYYLAGALALVSAVLYVVRNNFSGEPSRRTVFLMALGIGMLIIGRIRSRFS